MSGSKYDSGAEKRKRKRTHNDFMKSQQGSILKHFKRSTADEDLEEHMVIETANVQMMNVGSAVEYSASDTVSNESQSAYVLDKEPPLAATILSTFHNTLGSEDGEMQQIDYNDIGCWPATNKQIVSSIVVKGPTRIMDCNFPENKGRRFLTAYYKQKLPNSETVDRRWLVYSMHLDRAFCFCCKLFSNSTSKFSHDGYCGWKNITAILAEHETSNHIKAHKIWVDTKNRLNQKQTIDSEFQRCILAEEMHWRGVLERLLAINSSVSGSKQHGISRNRRKVECS